MRSRICAALCGLALAACAGEAWCADQFELTSLAFKDGDMLPNKYGCDQTGPVHPGQNISPPLAWSNPPLGTKSFVVMLTDPDGGHGAGSVHWVAYDIAPKTTSIAEGAGTAAPMAWVGGSNGSSNRYRGPCAPLGDSVHHYVITLVASAIASGALKPGLTHDELTQALKGHALMSSSLVVRYERH
jgi:Raf kinase inhibitor-like YbhB/YbcL family protein